MIYLTYAERMIISLSTVVVLAVLIFIFILLYKKQRIKMIKTKMLTMNDVVKYKHFMPFVKYQLKQEEDFSIILLHVNNLDILAKQYSNYMVTAYLRKLAKNVSMHLTYGAKLAQTPQRDLFAIYIPKEESLDLLLLAYSMKDAANENLYIKNAVAIKKNISIGFAINDKTNTYTELMDKAMMALVQSKRQLGEVVYYDEDVATSIIDYRTVVRNLRLTTTQYKLYDTYMLATEEMKNYTLKVKVNHLEEKEFLKQIPLKDQGWVNFWLIENIFKEITSKKLNDELEIPVLLKTLESENIAEAIENLCIAYEIDPQGITVSLMESEIIASQKVVENILKLKELGMTIAYNVTNISPEIYHSIQSYHATIINLTKKFIDENKDALDELLYFAKFNHLDILVSSNENLDKVYLENYHATLYSKVSSKNTLFIDRKSQKRAKDVKK
ncbi:conserved hypothetical protein (hypothetical surface-anchored protein) [Alteracholeplasma palmae J233]|uniref:GGDEF domain-containing protein n=1 Tax=Alteracholeplasma palmae (strain ATCC 49389 / J233) TaxID=1318466 RepID=U4KKI2_ALTPJ|nr:diguanylate cyclase [Alteracholeplasma palmae]CCV64249.1 conserved hypothetical protein (hypothetical surface-anchored protein) [Alteracholeplasma palmae J233]